MAAAGFFGKLPAHGDFVDRNWPAAAIAAWDDWLQRALHDSREQLGEHWLDTYLTSPLWRFALSAGCVDEQCWLGILLPSVDRVGRYFPLLLAVPGAHDSHLAGTLLAARDWFAELERIGLAALEQALSADALQAQLQALAPPPWLRAPDAGAGIYRAGALIDALPDLLEWQWRSQNDNERRASLWSSAGSSAVQPCVLLARGLPQPQGFAAMLDGSWRARGWSEN